MHQFSIEDIKRLNYIKYSSFRTLIKNTHSIWYCMMLYLIRIPVQFLKRRFGRNIISDILFVAPSINNQKSINPIVDCLSKDKCSIWMNLTKELPLFQIFLGSIKYLNVFFRLYLSSSVEERKLIRFFYDDFITTCATYVELEKLLLRNKHLKIIVLANDHNLVNRCLVELGEKHHIRTLYIQHASVTERFPPLRFDFAFLDGLESFEKYKNIGNMRGNIFLSGSPRFDALCAFKEKEKKYDVGIALSTFDSMEKALDLCIYIKEKYSYRIIVRPHPALLNGIFDDKLFESNGFFISDPREDLSYEFLSEIKVMIANESSIHLDAALMGTPSFLYNFSDNQIMDWYSYIKKGLIKVCYTFEDIDIMLKSKHELPVNVIRYYVSSFRSPMDGKVGEMIATFIKKVCEENEGSAFDYIHSKMIQNAEYAIYKY